MNIPIATIGDRLHVGQIPTSFSPLSKIFPGQATINGPLCVGAIGGDVPIANAMFAPGFTPQTSAVSLASIGVTNIFGSLNVLAISNFTGVTNKFGSTIMHALNLKNGVDIKNALDLGNGPVVVNGLLTASGNIKTATITAAVGSFTSVTAPFKLFNIPHPTKSNYRLIHSCLEGPENGVYYRGHLSNSNTINLPDYWEGLVDIETITVHLTPHKFHQELYVKSIDWGKVINILNNNGGPIECDYVVYAERKDVEKLKVEVENVK